MRADVFQDVIVAALFRAFHARVDDGLLDRAARAAGCASGIGRLSFLSDALTTQIVGMLALESTSSLLDLGCGRGFLARWLQREGYHGRYLGVDRIAEAIGAARAGVEAACPADAERFTFVQDDFRAYRPEPRVDAVVALEVTDDVADAALLDAMARALRPGGRFVITAARLDGPAPRAPIDDDVRARFGAVEALDATAQAGPFAGALYRALLEIADWDATIAPRIAAQARDVLDALARGTFAYTILHGTA